MHSGRNQEENQIISSNIILRVWWLPYPLFLYMITFWNIKNAWGGALWFGLCFLQSLFMLQISVWPMQPSCPMHSLFWILKYNLYLECNPKEHREARFQIFLLSMKTNHLVVIAISLLYLICILNWASVYKSLWMLQWHQTCSSAAHR